MAPLWGPGRRLFVAAEQFAEESCDVAAGWSFSVALAALCFRDAGERLFDVLAAAGPGWFAAGLAGDASAHGGGPFHEGVFHSTGAGWSRSND